MPRNHPDTSPPADEPAEGVRARRRFLDPSLGDLAERVRRLRAENPYRPMPVRAAVDLARSTHRDPAAYPFLREISEGVGQVSGGIGPFTVHVRVVVDQDTLLGQDDVTGTFTDTRSATTLRNRHRDWATDYTYYEPSTYRRAQTRADYTRLGMSKAVAEAALRYERQLDMAEDATRVYYGVTVTITLDRQELAQAALYSIDTITGHDGHDGRGYLIEVAEDLIEEALSRLREEGPRTVRAAREHLARLVAVFDPND